MGEKGAMLNLKLKESDQHTSSGCSFLKKFNCPQLSVSQLGEGRGTDTPRTNLPLKLKRKMLLGSDSFNKQLVGPPPLMS